MPNNLKKLANFEEAFIEAAKITGNPELSF